MPNVFLQADAAHTLLRRLPRANSLFEEIKHGNIQRECREEICSYEEAREAFENDEKTRKFWEEYVRESSPATGLDVTGLQSLYLILPLLVGLLLIGVVMISVWRCHSRKLQQRNHAHSVTTLASSVLPTRGYHAELVTPESHNSLPCQHGISDPPPSYEEVVCQVDVRVHMDAPPQYEDIISGANGQEK